MILIKNNEKTLPAGRQGFALIETLVVVLLFAVLSIIATQSLATTLRNVRKTDNNTKVRQSLDFAVSVIERQVRNANSITSCANPQALLYSDAIGQATSFSCFPNATNGYIASGSARLTSDQIIVTSCSFTCSAATNTTPPSVDINLTARDAGVINAESAAVTVTTKVFLRTY